VSADHAPGVVSVVGRIGRLAAVIAQELAHAALRDRLGYVGGVNVSGDEVKKLDIWGHETVLAGLRGTGACAAFISEEATEPIEIPEAGGAHGVVVCCDPVDGSSNLDVNGIVGTIFSVLRKRGEGSDHPRADALQPGTTQAAAGYIMYGPSTLLVLTTGDGVHGFTVDRASGAWVRTHTNLRMPARGRTYSVNDGNFTRWPDGIRRFVEHVRQIDVPSGRPYTARYAGSLVTDVHRTLLEGGIYLYPEDAAGSGKQSSGKLRLMYEASPMGWIIEQAGGAASTGRARILDLVPTAPHQRVPLLIGSAEDVRLAEDFYAGKHS
jgi:fructose-1,6-bisphosphatase I